MFSLGSRVKRRRGVRRRKKEEQNERHSVDVEARGVKNTGLYDSLCPPRLIRNLVTRPILLLTIGKIPRSSFRIREKLRRDDRQRRICFRAKCTGEISTASFKNVAFFLDITKIVLRVICYIGKDDSSRLVISPV